MELILGDNPFFGINHRSQAKASKYLEGKGDFGSASDVVECAYELGVRRMMVSNHADLPTFLNKISENFDGALAQLKLALVVPYAQKFNQIVGSTGVLGLVTGLPYGKASIGAFELLTSSLFREEINLEKIIELLLDAELSSVSDYTNSIDMLCLHNIVTDLCIGLNKIELIRQFCDICRTMGKRPVIVTQNPVLLDSILPDDAILCFSYNKIGFMVNPSVAAVRENLAFGRDYWAMSILASGAVSLEDALEDEFLVKFSGIIYATGSKDRAADSIPKILKSVA
jgi:hypothetical protein